MNVDRQGEMDIWTNKMAVGLMVVVWESGGEGGVGVGVWVRVRVQVREVQVELQL